MTLKVITIWYDKRNGMAWVQQDTAEPIDVEVVEYDGGTHEQWFPKTTVLPNERTRVKTGRGAGVESRTA